MRKYPVESKAALMVHVTSKRVSMGYGKLSNLEFVDKLVELNKAYCEKIIDLTTECVELESVRECLWPGGDMDSPWSPETLDQIADVVRKKKSTNAGCDRCGTRDREPGSKYCSLCLHPTDGRLKE